MGAAYSLKSIFGERIATELTENTEKDLFFRNTSAEW
jgi:hypothetical protein